MNLRNDFTIRENAPTTFSWLKAPLRQSLRTFVYKCKYSLTSPSFGEWCLMSQVVAARCEIIQLWSSNQINQTWWHLACNVIHRNLGTSVISIDRQTGEVLTLTWLSDRSCFVGGKMKSHAVWCQSCQVVMRLVCYLSHDSYGHVHVSQSVSSYLLVFK